MQNNFNFDLSTVANLRIGLFKYSLSPEDKFIIFNSGLTKILGYPSKNDIVKRRFANFFLNPQERDEFFRVLRRQNKVDSFKTAFKDKEGKAVWVAISATLITDGHKKQYFEGIIEDISAHKDTEDELSLERDFLQGLLENIPDAIYFKDRHNQIIKVNKFYAKGIGSKPEEITGKTDFDFFPEDQARKMFEDDNYVLKTGKPIIGKIERTLLRDGTWNQVITTKIPMYDRKGRIIGTMGITRDMTNYANLEKERLMMLINALTVLVKVLEMRDPYTSSHTQNVANIAEKIGNALGWDESRIIVLKLAGELHDLGKISIPLDILNKPGKLNDLEYRLIQEHVKNCYDLIKEIKFPFSLAEIVYQHHERLDGSGYPEKIKKDKICPEARILAVSDVLESMTSYRPYRKALGLEKALEELKRGCGTKYDPKIVEAVFKLVKDNNGKAFWVKG